MPDIQNSIDTRRIPIQLVGVRGIRYPIRVRAADGTTQSSVGTFDMYIYLQAERKGTHMSRFVSLLEDYNAPFDMSSFGKMAKDMLFRLQSKSGRISINFPYFISKIAPVSGIRSLLDYQVTITAYSHIEKRTNLRMKVLVPVTSLCPCSKQISQYGAHNQRSHITIDAELLNEIEIDLLVRIAEESASCELWGLLKRPDEKFVTERAYENPKFVEDLARDIAIRLNAEPSVGSYTLETENFESIHNHSVYALIEHDKKTLSKN